MRGERRRFEVDLEMRGTAWEERVWDALRHISYGERRSYSEVASALGNAGEA